MNSSVVRKDVFRKYARILHGEETSPNQKVVYPPINYQSPQRHGQSDILEQLIQMKHSNSNSLASSFISSQAYGIKPAAPKSKNSFNAADISIHSSPPKMLTSPASENLVTGYSSYAEDKQLEGVLHTPTRSLTKGDWFELPSGSNMEGREKRDMPTLGLLASGRSRKTFNPYGGEKEITLEDLYSDAREFSEDLRSIVSQDHDQAIKMFTKHLNVKEFVKIQKSRLNSVIRAVEKGYVQKIAQENKIRHEIWLLLFSEINGIKTSYDNFLMSFEDALDKVTKGKKKMDDSMKPWEGIKMLMQYTPLFRSAKSHPENKANQEKFDELTKSIYNFKIEFKVSREFKQELYEIFELLELQFKELNQMLDQEREKIEKVDKERAKLLQDYKELEEKNEKLKDEMIALIQDWKKGTYPGNQQDSPAEQEKTMKNKIQELQADVGKAAEENTQLKKDLREAKLEIRKMLQKDEKATKSFKEKGIMVDLYSKASLGVVSIKLSSYITEPETCKDGSLMPKELITAFINMIYSDKVIVDLCDDFEKRPRKPLNDFVPEWFLKRFGIYMFGETLLRDLMYSINTTANSDRNRVFKELLGVEVNGLADTFKYNLGANNQPDKLKLKKVAFCTAEMMRQFSKVIELIRSSKQASEQQNYGPYLPGLGQNQDLVPNEVARSVLRTIIKDKNLSSDEAADAEDYLYLIQQNEAYSKDPDGRGHEEGSSDKKFIRFDVLVKFFMEVIVERHAEAIDRYYNSFRTRMTSKQGSLSYDEFNSTVNNIDPKATQAWKDHTFWRLMTEYTNQKIPLIKLMENFVKCYFQEDQVKEFYQQMQVEKHPKTDVSLSKLDKTPTKQKSSKKLPVQSQETFALQPVQTRTRLLQSEKEAFNLPDTGLTEEGYNLYDTVSSLIILQETYYMVEEKIQIAEKTVDGLTSVHEEFTSNLSFLPKRFSKVGKLENLTLFMKDELVDFLEELWAKYRNVLAIAFRSK